MEIISVDNNGKLEICGLNLVSHRLEDDKDYEVKFNLSRNEKDGVSVKNLVFSEIDSDEMND